MNITYQEFSIDRLEEILQLWNQELVYDRISKERFFEQILYDENFNSQLFKLAIADNQVVGFVYGIKRQVPYLTRGLEPTRGWILQVAVAQSWKRQGIAKALVSQVEEDLQTAGATEITLCAFSPNYFAPGIDLRYTEGLAFFKALGYLDKGDAVSMGAVLTNHEVDVESILAEKRKQGIRIMPYEDRYYAKILEFAEAEFGGGWHRNLLLAMQAGEASETIFLAVDEDDQVIGFTMRKIDGNDTRFGPIGVSSKIRSKGLGSALLEVMLDDLIKRGIYYTFFLWTHGKTIDFYRKHGFEIYRTYELSRKELKK
ncbi:hypothetical protein UAS_00065 [Enterococcus asini ATCC 700915]|uniref:N-acetyltransferase domain-containing protein n=1 Tax=Enterococcus asini ATCC 700915 TaxID=1158606 RepID=R2S486_9ENTE|nr:GNAT family N-acetyltransferase [Enterococcus asini]EOH90340.1 hypothetical protein UAS_00065 [Enterococcus asini ATCC 700915]EOT57028.1 hypothetical protein I579_00534 [Enterococcus asini ATCC 700915]OJG12408.1 hypothetical protein RU94_GL002199 [Enterococcus asini]